MALSQITYNDKSNYQSSSLANEYKVTANDMNEIKSVVNGAVTQVDTLTPVTLYSSSGGTNSNVTLSDSASNYSYIEIFFKNGDNIFSSVKVSSPNNKTASLSFNTYNAGVSAYQLWMTNVSISGTTITHSQDYYVDGSGLHTANYIYIVKVLGYK